MADPLTRWLHERATASQTLQDSTTPKDYSENRDWRNLRFEGGDVVVKLTRHPSGWRLLHSSVLSEASPVLAKSFQKEWSRAKTVNDPANGKEVQVHTLSLMWDPSDETYFLQTEVW